jgi:hypothetical protein
MKSEIRNPTAERGPKSDGRKETGNRKRPFRFSVFGIPSVFGFRPSDFAPVWLAAGAALLLAVAPGLRAQQSGSATDFTGSATDFTGSATDFTHTEYYPNQQQIKSILSGAEALLRPGGRFIIKQFKLQTFDSDGKTNKVVTAPECLYDEKNGTANSSGPVQLQNGDGKYRVAGEGFLWRQTNSFLTISNNVHTVIEDRAKLNTKS